MIFLNPAVLFGLLAASIPVLIHLLNLRKLKRIEFSTLAFLKELQKNKIRKIKLKQWLLLALRVLIILFLVTAFARPTLKGVAIGGTTSAAKTTAVFILDNTPSMSVVDAKGSYLNQAKAAIKELLNQLQEGDDAALLLVSEPNNNDVKTTTNLADFQKQVDAVKISDESGMLNSAVVKAAKILSASQNFNKEVYIFSDFQQGRLAGKGDLSNLSQLLNDKVRIYSFDYAGKDVYNAGIDDFKLNTQIFEKDKPVSFNVTVTNYSSQSISNLVVSLFINGERSAQQSVSLGAGESRIITMEASVNSTGFINAFAEIEDDEIMQDNRRYINFYIPQETPVIIFSDEPDDAKFVNIALSAGNGESTLKVVNKSLNQIAAVDLTQYNVVVIIGSSFANGSIGGLDRLKSYLTTGGGIFIMPGSNSTLNSFQQLTSVMGIPSPAQAAGTVNSVSNPVRFDKVDFTHPVFSDLYSNNVKKAVESPDVYYHFKINTEGKGQSIISLMDGSSFLSEFNIGKGKIFVLSTAPVLSWSNFPLKSIFAPLINKSVYYLASKDRSDNQFITGNTAIINISGYTSPQIKIVRPDNSEDFINLQDKNNPAGIQTGTNYLEYKKTSIAGNYKVYSGKNIIDEFSVNPDPLESVAKYLTVKDFENYLKEIDFKGKFINVSKNEDPAKIVLQSRFGSELWRYFLLVAILLALIEMLVARNAKKELTNSI